MDINIEELRQLAEQQLEISNQYRKELSTMPHKVNGNFIAFLGRQTDPSYKWNLALKPLWSGFYIKYNNLELMVDPGINTLERAQRIGINLSKTNALFISHAHIDHKNDANLISEMVAYRDSADLRILMSQESINENIMSHFHLSSNNNKDGENLIILDNFKEIDLGDGIKLRPIEVFHSIGGSFGFVLDLGKIKIGYTADTGFYDTYKTLSGEYSVCDIKNKKEIDAPGAFNVDLINAFKGVDVLVFNLHGIDFKKNSAHNLYHSTMAGAIEVLSDSKIKLCVFDHFNPHGCLGPSYPEKVNKFIQQSTNKDTKLVGLNGLVVDLDKI
jgi:ribonuclease BN (tRNA processing enzyme)